MVSNVQRLGNFNSEKSGPTTQLLTLGNVWEARKTMSKALLLKNSRDKIDSPSSSPEEQLKERMTVKRRREINNRGTMSGSNRKRFFSYFRTSKSSTSMQWALMPKINNYDKA